MTNEIAIVCGLGLMLAFFVAMIWKTGKDPLGVLYWGASFIILYVLYGAMMFFAQSVDTALMYVVMPLNHLLIFLAVVQVVMFGLRAFGDTVKGMMQSGGSFENRKFPLRK